MRQRRVRRAVLGSMLSILGVALISTPVLAAGYDSTTEALIRTLTQQLVFIAVPILVLVEGLLVYIVYRYRNNDEAEPTSENRRLEIGWTVATALILLLVGVLSYNVMAQPAVEAGPSIGEDKPDDAVTMTITGYQWYWDADYPNANVTIEQADTIYLPVDRPLYIYVNSGDVIHSVHVPGLGLKKDAMPGQRSLLRTEITNEGEYQLYCAEFCGVGHSDMTATIKAVSYEEYQDWLAQQKQEGA